MKIMGGSWSADTEIPILVRCRAYQNASHWHGEQSDADIKQRTHERRNTELNTSP